MSENIDIIDWQARDSAKNCITTGYVPRTRSYVTPNKYEPSGIIIAKCVDLGQMDKMDLRSLFIRRKLIDKLAPYIGLQGHKARVFLDNEPLVLTRMEAIQLDEAVREYLSENDNVFSTAGIDLLKEIEQLRLEPYDDQTGKPITTWIKDATIGYGHLISSRDWDQFKHGINEDKALALFKIDVARFEEKVNNTVSIPLTQHQFDALIFLAYNIGEEGFADSSVVKLLNNDPDADPPSYSDLETAWKAWKYSDGKINDGLINRRNAEWKMYTEAIYERW